MRKIIDISMPLNPEIVQWPGSTEFSVKWTNRIRYGDPVNNSSINLDTHCGTHIDAPLHHIDDGESIDKIPLEMLIGPVYVIDVRGEPLITRKIAEQLDIPGGTKRILFKTDNSRNQNRRTFDENYVAISPDAAEWMVKSRIELVGIDYLSIQRYNSSDQTHNILLKADVGILEGIDLRNVEEGWYTLVCLPLRLIGLEGAPARAILISEPEDLENE
jgi:arylformamidase